MSASSLGSWRWLIDKFVRPQRRRSRQQNFVKDRPVEIEQLEARKMLTVTYHGGDLLTSVNAQAVYLGSDWSTNSTENAQTGQLDQFLNTLVTGQYMDMLTNAGYGVGRGASSAGAIDNISISKTSGITDAAIQQDIQSMISAGQLKAPDANNLYVVYVEQGVVIHSGTDSSATTFLGYHGAFAGQTATGTPEDIHYAVIAYPGGPNPSPTSQGFTSAFNEMTSVSSHEVAEAVTDPNVNYKAIGWYDDQKNGEIGDLTRLDTTFNGYVVQDVVNQNDQPISPTSGTTTTLAAPQNVAATALSSTSAQVTWNSVSGAQGYRVYMLQGSNWVLAGTVGASTTSATINGLTAGSTVSLKVEAYNGSNVADSQSVSVTLPSAATLNPPQNVAATALSSTSAQVTWNASSGAQGYRVYVLQGSNWVVAGTVGSSVTSVTVNGLTAGSTVSFKIEAFSGSTVADSQTVSVTLPSSTTNNFTVTATVLSSNTVQLSWNNVTGAQGYRIYWSDGTTKYFLGTVRAGSTSVNIVGLVPGTTYQFQIEAFRGGKVLQDSNWVSVNSASAAPTAHHAEVYAPGNYQQERSKYNY